MHKPHLVVFKRRLLSISETFIRDQMLALTRHKASLLGFKPEKRGLNLESLVIKYVAGLNKITEVFCNLFNLPIPAAVKSFKSLQPDLVHLHFGTQAYKIWPSVEVLNVPTFVTLHGTDINIYKEIWESGKKGLIGRYYPKRLIKLSQHPNVRILAVSKAIKQRAIEFGIPADKISVSYIGVDTNRFQAPTTPVSQRSNVILFVGRFVENKGPHILIEAFDQAKQQIPNLELVMVGEGPWLEKCQELATELNVAVDFLGRKTSDEVAQEMAKAKLFCLPSFTLDTGVSEGFGLVLLEAMASGVPCITSARGGAHEGVIHNQTGICFPEKDIQTLSDGIVRVLQDDNLLEQFSQNGLDRVKTVFDNKVTTSQLEDLYQQALDAKEKQE